MENKQPLPNISVLFQETWQIYKKYYKTLLLIALISGAPIILYIFSFVTLRQRGIIIVISLLLYLIGIILTLWGTIAFILFLKNPKLTFENLFSQSWKYFFPIMWIEILTGILVTVGVIFLIIPGLIAVIFFIFARFLNILEGPAGLSALVASRNLVSNYWWPIFARLIVLLLVLLIPAALLSLLLYMFKVPLDYGQIFNTILGYIFMSYIYTFLYALYKQIKQIKKPAEYLKLTINK